MTKILGLRSIEFANTVACNPVTEADEAVKLRLCVEAARAISG